MFEVGKEVVCIKPLIRRSTNTVVIPKGYQDTISRLPDSETIDLVNLPALTFGKNIGYLKSHWIPIDEITEPEVLKISKPETTEA